MNQSHRISKKKTQKKEKKLDKKIVKWLLITLGVALVVAIGVYIYMHYEPTYNSRNYKSDLPVIYINVDDEIVKDDYIEGDMYVQGNDEYASQYDGKIEIKGRGNNTWGYEKKPYKIKLDEKTDMFGMGENKHWILLANYIDTSSMRNTLASDIAKNFGIDGMDSIWVDVVLNGKYIGLYQFCEHLRVDEDRVDIQTLEEAADDLIDAIKEEGTEISDDDEKAITEDYSWATTDQVTINGKDYRVSDYIDVNEYMGYLLELSDEQDELTCFNTNNDLQVMVNTPEYLSTNEQLLSNLEEDFNSLEEAYSSYNGYNSKGQHYSELADMDSMIGYWLVNELIGKTEADMKSRFAYKAAGGLWTFGPVWDYDRAAAALGRTDTAQEWVFSTGLSTDNFMGQWLDDPYFLIKAEELYQSHREYLESIVEDGGLIDTYYAMLKKSAKKDMSLWKESRKNTLNSEYINFDQDLLNLKEYLQKRLEWMDQQFADDQSVIDSLGSAYASSTYQQSDDFSIMLDENEISEGSHALAYINSEGEEQSFELYVNGIQRGSYKIDEGDGIEILSKWLTEESGEKNVINIIGFNSQGEETYQAYATLVVNDNDGNKE